jgi:hypothetical protein
VVDGTELRAAVLGERRAEAIGALEDLGAVLAPRTSPKIPRNPRRSPLAPMRDASSRCSDADSSATASSKSAVSSCPAASSQERPFKLPGRELEERRFKWTRRSSKSAFSRRAPFRLGSARARKSDGYVAAAVGGVSRPSLFQDDSAIFPDDFRPHLCRLEVSRSFACVRRNGAGACLPFEDRCADGFDMIWRCSSTDEKQRCHPGPWTGVLPMSLIAQAPSPHAPFNSARGRDRASVRCGASRCG